MASDAVLEEAIDLISSVDGVVMDPGDLAEDVFLLDSAFPDESVFMAAVLSTQRALGQLVADTLTPAWLEDDLDGWQSYHYQHSRKQGAQADMRIVFRRVGESLQVRGFGHRALPTDIYRRMVATRS